MVRTTARSPIPRQRRALRRSAIGALACATALAVASPVAHATTSVTDQQAGTTVGWGADTDYSIAARTLPAPVQGTAISAIAAGADYSIALTAAGQVVPLTLGDMAQRQAVADLPGALSGTRAVAVAASGSGAAAVTEAGKVVVWGTSDAPAPPGDLTDATDVALSSYWGVALTRGGTVRAWGNDNYGQVSGADGITGVAAITVGNDHGYALKSDGTVVAWGRNQQRQTNLPAVLTDATDDVDVTAISARANGGLALLSDHTLVSWGQFTSLGAPPPTTANNVPASLTGKTVIAISANGNNNIALDSEGGITVWGNGVADEVKAVSNVSSLGLGVGLVRGVTIGGQGTGGFAIVLASRVLPIARPTVTGTATEGQTLTGYASTFSGDHDPVTNQWIRGTQPITGATGPTYKLTKDDVGFAISYRSTAKSGDSTVDSTSAPTALVRAVAVPRPPAVTKVASRTTITKARAAKHGKKVTITVKVATPGATPAGTVKVVIKKGKKTVFRGTATVNARGIATIKANKKKKLTKKGKYKVTATYSGTTRINPSTAKARTYRV